MYSCGVKACKQSSLSYMTWTPHEPVQVWAERLAALNSRWILSHIWRSEKSRILSNHQQIKQIQLSLYKKQGSGCNQNYSSWTGGPTFGQRLFCGTQTFHPSASRLHAVWHLKHMASKVFKLFFCLPIQVEVSTPEQNNSYFREDNQNFLKVHARLLHNTDWKPKMSYLIFQKNSF